MMETEKGKSPLYPEDDPERWEKLVASIVASAESELARRRSQRDVLEFITGWSRPVLSVAAILVAVSSAVLALAWDDGGVQGAVGRESPVLAEAVIPSDLVSWVAVGSDVSMVELAEVLEEYR